jgi:gluconolactonase
VWRIGLDGRASIVADNMGTTNGIEVSPDGRTLYVNESTQRIIWAFAIAADGSLGGKRKLASFTDFGLDGMRVDVDGCLYVTRYDKGTVIKLSPEGRLLREIALPGKKPSNITFGGPDGRTAYVTEVENGQLLQFRVDRPGFEWQLRQQEATPD